MKTAINFPDNSPDTATLPSRKSNWGGRIRTCDLLINSRDLAPKKGRTTGHEPAAYPTKVARASTESPDKSPDILSAFSPDTATGEVA